MKLLTNSPRKEQNRNKVSPKCPSTKQRPSSKENSHETRNQQTTTDTKRSYAPAFQKRPVRNLQAPNKALQARSPCSKDRNTGVCMCTCGDRQTVQHILMDCPTHAELRRQVWSGQTTMEGKLWGTRSDLELTADFIRQSGLCA